MDLSQTKLTRSEWNSIEIPIAQKEKDIITLICKGYDNVNTSMNNTLSLLQYLKIKTILKFLTHLYQIKKPILK